MKKIVTMLTILTAMVLAGCSFGNHAQNPQEKLEEKKEVEPEIEVVKPKLKKTKQTDVVNNQITETEYTYDLYGSVVNYIVSVNGTGKSGVKYFYTPTNQIKVTHEYSDALFREGPDYINSYTYDENDVLTKIERVNKLQEKVEQTRLYEYYPNGKLKRETLKTSETNVLYYNYEYNDAGNIVKQTVYDGDSAAITTTYNYDSNGVLKSVVMINKDESTYKCVISYEYNKAGKVSKTTNVYSGSLAPAKTSVIVSEYNKYGDIEKETATEDEVVVWITEYFYE